MTSQPLDPHSSGSSAVHAPLAPLTAGDALGAFVDELERRALLRQPADAVRTGMELDVQAPVRRGEVTLVAGRPGSGVSAMLATLARSAAAQVPVLHVVTGVEASTVVSRHVQAVGRIPAQALMRGDLDEEQWVRIGDAMATVGDLPLRMLGLRAGVVDGVDAVIDLVDDDVGLVVLDRLDDVLEDERVATEAPVDVWQQAGRARRAMRRLAAVARDRDCAIVVGSRLRRAEADHVGAVPVHDDLVLDDVAAGHAASVVALHRDELTDPYSDHRGIVDVHVLRAGSTNARTHQMAYLDHVFLVAPLVRATPPEAPF